MSSANRTDAALKRGADELENLLEYVLRERPRALKLARARYIKFILTLYRAIQRASL